MGMANKSISLGDKFNLQKSNVLLNGTQGLVRLMLGQKQRDEKLGLNTAGFVTGYRGSPLGAVDFQMKRAAKELKASKIEFKEHSEVYGDKFEDPMRRTPSIEKIVKATGYKPTMTIPDMVKEIIEYKNIDY